VTGIVTNIGIELGKLLYWNGNAAGFNGPAVRANRAKLGLLTSLLGMFLLGGLSGAVGFKYLGFIATLPLAAVLLTLAAVPVLDDLMGQPR
jgi:hypothetical protein